MYSGHCWKNVDGDSHGLLEDEDLRRIIVFVQDLASYIFCLACKIKTEASYSNGFGGSSQVKVKSIFKLGRNSRASGVYPTILISYMMSLGGEGEGGRILAGPTQRQDQGTVGGERESKQGDNERDWHSQNTYLPIFESSDFKFQTSRPLDLTPSQPPRSRLLPNSLSAQSSQNICVFSATIEHTARCASRYLVTCVEYIEMDLLTFGMQESELSLNSRNMASFITTVSVHDIPIPP